MKLKLWVWGILVVVVVVVLGRFCFEIWSQYVALAALETAM